MPEPPAALETMSSRSVPCAPQAYKRISVPSLMARLFRLKRQVSLVAPGNSSMTVRLAKLSALVATAAKRAPWLPACWVVTVRPLSCSTLPASGVTWKLRYLVGFRLASVTLWNAAQPLVAVPFSMLAVWSAAPSRTPAATWVAPWVLLAAQLPMGLY